MCHRMPVDALLVELLAKIVGQRSQVRFLLDALKLIVPAGLENLRYRYEEGTNSKEFD